MSIAAPSFLRPKRGLWSRWEAAGGDLTVLIVILLPGAVIAGLFYLGGGVWLAAAIAAVAFALSAFVAPQVGLYAYFALQGVDAAFSQAGGNSFTPAKALGPFLLLPYSLWLMRRRVRMHVARPFVVSMLLFGLFGLVTSVIAIDPGLALQFSGQTIVQVLLVAMAVHVLNTRAYVGRAMFWTVTGGGVAATALMITGGVSHHFARGTLGDYANPNTTGLAISIALAAIPGAWVHTRNRLLWLFYAAIAPLLLAAIVRTGSRSAVLAVVAAFSVGIIIGPGTGIVKRALIAVCCLAVIVATTTVVVRAGYLDRKSQLRLREFVLDRGSGAGDDRKYIWKMAFDTYLSRPLLGSGFGNAAAAMEQEHGYSLSVHSTYLEALVDGGPAAFGLMTYALWSLLSATRHMRRSRAGVPAMIILVLLLVSGIAHTILFTKWFWVPASLCLILAEQAQRESTPDREEAS